MIHEKTSQHITQTIDYAGWDRVNTIARRVDRIIKREKPPVVRASMRAAPRHVNAKLRARIQA